jgi:hypothetical protein|tara:strand:- start:250 stop:492 length:243 start_codon:yes stop_codon:yes gene_type:complete
MEGIIRKIIIGKDPKDAMAYYVGMRAGKGEVSAIVRDEKHLHRYGKNRYLVYLQDEKDSSQALWKSVDDMPCMLEFDCNF